MRLFVLCVQAILFCLPAGAEPLRIVAAENFYGGVAAQIGGPAATVTSILSNPNQDPHEFTTDAATARAVADADIVIYNGLGYDVWMEKLLGAPGKRSRTVIRVADLIGAKDGDNPHVWYDPQTMNALADKLGGALQEREDRQPPMQNIDPDRGWIKAVLKFKRSLLAITDRITVIRSNNQGTTVTATEPVFGYMASALGFKMLNYDFQIAVMNDTEPSAAQTAAFEKSLTSHTAKILFYNSQVTDPTTDRLKKIAEQAGVPIVGVTETQPTDYKTYVDWMSHELDAVQAGLAISRR